MTRTIWIDPEIYQDDVRIVRSTPTNFEVWDDEEFLGEFATYSEAADLCEQIR
jgi:hypothetical protein